MPIPTSARAGSPGRSAPDHAHHEQPWTLLCTLPVSVKARTLAAKRTRAKLPRNRPSHTEAVVPVPVAGLVPVAVGGAEVLRIVVPGTATQHTGPIRSRGRRRRKAPPCASNLFLTSAHSGCKCNHTAVPRKTGPLRGLLACVPAAPACTSRKEVTMKEVRSVLAQSYRETDRATRKPLSPFRSPGRFLLRLAARRITGLPLQEPPRNTRRALQSPDVLAEPSVGAPW